MKYLLLTLFFSINMIIVFSQPSLSTIQNDIKKELGTNCLNVIVTGKGSFSEEIENGKKVKFFRITVNANLKTDINGVNRLMKGAAVYTMFGNNYQFRKYNTASGEYTGLTAPNVTEIKSFIMSLSDFALGSLANNIIELESIELDNTNPKWHTLQSVSIKALYTYWQKKSDFELEKLKVPFELRLYRKDGDSPWHQASLIKPNAADDNRKTVIIGTKKYNHEKTIIEKSMQKQSENNFNNLPTVTIPNYTNIKDIAIWVNNLLIEGDIGKAEKMFLSLIHPSQKNSAGLLNAFASNLVDKMKNSLNNDFSRYNKQYCSNLSVKELNKQTIEWWNKDRSKFCRLSVQIEQSKWYISDLSINLWQSFNAKNAEMTMNTKCN